jgi:hypothetical protein
MLAKFYECIYIVFKKLYKKKVVYTLYIYRYVTFIEECYIATIEIFKHLKYEKLSKYISYL